MRTMKFSQRVSHGHHDYAECFRLTLRVLVLCLVIFVQATIVYSSVYVASTSDDGMSSDSTDRRDQVLGSSDASAQQWIGGLGIELGIGTNVQTYSGSMSIERQRFLSAGWQDESWGVRSLGIRYSVSPQMGAWRHWSFSLGARFSSVFSMEKIITEANGGGSPESRQVKALYSISGPDYYASTEYHYNGTNQSSPFLGLLVGMHNAEVRSEKAMGTSVSMFYPTSTQESRSMFWEMRVGLQYSDPADTRGAASFGLAFAGYHYRGYESSQKQSFEILPGGLVTRLSLFFEFTFRH